MTDDEIRDLMRRDFAREHEVYWMLPGLLLAWALILLIGFLLS